MRKLMYIVGLLIVSLTLKASDYYEQLNYCTWMGSAAHAIAKNRDLGLDEYSLIGKYLEQGDEHNEQVVVIDLIERIYGSQKDEDADTLKLVTKTECLGMLFSSTFNGSYY